MNAQVKAPSLPSRITRLLAIALVVVTVLPILIFATDFTNSHALQSFRTRTLQRAGVGLTPESQDARRERNRIRRASMYPTASTVATSMAFHLVVLIVIGVAGRRIFALRL
jgi:hypothetical protein